MELLVREGLEGAVGVAGDTFVAAGESAAPVNRIRVETALSRFPIHRLAKKQTVTIDLEQTNADGDPIKWQVGYNQTHGQPGPLAYKIDTLIVNRCLDEAGRPLPAVIRLGSLTEMCRGLGVADSGENRANVKKALHQNASAYITARFGYKTKTGKLKHSEIGYTRYSVVFTGEVAAGRVDRGRGVHRSHAAYRELLNHVEVRPLDYDYLTLLAPGPQRFYELLSFQMYGGAGRRAAAGQAALRRLLPPRPASAVRAVRAGEEADVQAARTPPRVGICRQDRLPAGGRRRRPRRIGRCSTRPAPVRWRNSTPSPGDSSSGRSSS